MVRPDGLSLLPGGPDPSDDSQQARLGWAFEEAPIEGWACPWCLMAGFWARQPGKGGAVLLPHTGCTASFWVMHVGDPVVVR